MNTQVLVIVVQSQSWSSSPSLWSWQHLVGVGSSHTNPAKFSASDSPRQSHQKTFASGSLRCAEWTGTETRQPPMWCSHCGLSIKMSLIQLRADVSICICIRGGFSCSRSGWAVLKAPEESKHMILTGPAALSGWERAQGDAVRISYRRFFHYSLWGTAPAWDDIIAAVCLSAAGKTIITSQKHSTNKIPCWRRDHWESNVRQGGVTEGFAKLSPFSFCCCRGRCAESGILTSMTSRRSRFWKLQS